MQAGPCLYHFRPCTVAALPLYSGFRFRDELALSDGTIVIRLPSPGEPFLLLYVRVFLADISLLLGLDVLRAFQLSVDFRLDVLTSQSPPWSLQMRYAAGHPFLSPDAMGGSNKRPSV